MFVLSKKKFVGGDHFVLTSTDLFVVFKKFVCSVLLRDWFSVRIYHDFSIKKINLNMSKEEIMFLTGKVKLLLFQNKHDEALIVSSLNFCRNNIYELLIGLIRYNQSVINE